ncbi:MAG: hypothetical protein NC819_03850 [Candidatus Omnitrophica bacterium]|nr:hypothetical protein [Candidatus Omnitrophota bacterium]
MWFHFFLSSAGVIVAGIYVGRISGAIGDRLKLGHAWAGAVLLSFATALPELVSTITVASRGQVGMAIGNILGSCVFNLFILTLVDLIGGESIYRRVSINHMATGLLGCALIGLVIIGIGMGHGQVFGADGIGIGHVGTTSLLLLGFYGVGQVALLKLAKESFSEETEPPSTVWYKMPIQRLFPIFGGFIALIFVSAYNLGISVEKIAAHYNLGATFAGVTLLGIITSLPETTNAVVCARRREFDLAIGNILGANAFDLTALGIADFFYLRGRFFYEVGRVDAVSSIVMAAVALVMQAIVLGGLAIRSEHRIWRVGLIPLMLAALYVFSLVVSYQFSAPPLDSAQWK